MTDKEHFYFQRDTDWYDWLKNNHSTSDGVYLIFYKVDSGIPSMRWEEAVKVALCFGWIDSTVKSLGGGKRRQYFCRRNQKSVWSALNKRYIKELTSANLMHESGFAIIEVGKKNGSWTALDNVEKGVIPQDLQKEFDQNKLAFKNFQAFARSYQKNYLYWIHQAKREATRLKRIEEIIQLCESNKKAKGG